MPTTFIAGRPSVAQIPFFEAKDRPDGSLEIGFLTRSCGPAAPDGRTRAERVNILPGRYEELRALAGRFRGRMVVATGCGPIEGYFAIGYYATRHGAAGIVFEGANGSPRIAMPAADARPDAKPWLQVEHRDGDAVATVGRAPSSDGKWSLEAIAPLTPALLPATCRRISFTGPGAVHMYLLLGISAARAGLADVCVAKPSVPYAIRFTPDQAGETLSVPGGKSGVVVGIIGDPNSGKSVFARAFHMALRGLMPAWAGSWIYDCDLACPTPDWYFTALAHADEKALADYKDLRRSQKVKWNPEMERRCADVLGVLRTNLDMVVADLPGGRHKDADDNALPSPIRIDTAPGSHRVDMFRQCDAFVLICRKDRREAILRGWTEALAGIGLEGRLAAVLESSEPEAEFSISPLVPDAEGILRGDIRGLDRSHVAGGLAPELAGRLRPLVRTLMAIPVVNAARAATATAFLTGDKGTRYGAAVRSAATGRIFAAGQYSSFNHSTNIHAEMNALAHAAAAGEPDVDLLAITSTSAAQASPCGVCRQVIMEHATRTGRDFDVALTTPGARPVIVPVSGLLPHAWHPRATGASDDLRDFDGVASAFRDAPEPHVGSEFVEQTVHSRAADRIAIVWDDSFAPDAALVKYKYEQVPDGRWRKLPHAFTESAAYLRHLADSRCGSAAFNGLSVLGLPVGRTDRGEVRRLFKHPVPLAGDMLRLFGDTLFAPAGIDVAHAVRVTCSRMAGFCTEASDWDLRVAAAPEQIDALRARVAGLAGAGRVVFPDKSRSWKLVKDVFPGGAADGGARILAERRYAESFRLDGIPVSFLFVPPASARPEYAFPAPYAVVGRATVAGRVVEASRAPYKRSESVVETADRRRVRLLCYHKTANLLKAGDRVAAGGVLCRHAPVEGVLDCPETLVMSAPAVDRLVWLA